jgi:hypothetical protein
VYYDFVPRSKDVEIRMTRGRPSDIGEYVRPLDVSEIKALLREGVRRIVEYNTTGFMVWVPPSECFTYWEWAQPHIAQDDKPYLESYPNCFYLVPQEWKNQSGERLIVFERDH